jgi:uncharacterized protein with von Willebrand factor type A (vWA) domain
MEALDSLKIDFGIVGFSDSPVIHKEMKDKFTVTNRQQILGDINKAMGGGTNDNLGVQTGLDMFKRHGKANYRKVMIVLSDGLGNAAEVKRLQAKAKQDGIIVIGVGIGPGMDAITSVYDEHVLCPHIDKLPQMLADTVRQQIEGKDEKFA